MSLSSALPHVSPGERIRFVYTVGAFMCVASAALLARTVGDTLFLSRYPASSLSYMFIATAVVVGVVSFVYGAGAGRIPIDRLIIITCGCLAGLALAMRVGLLSHWGGFPICAYLLADLVANVPFMLAWSLAGMIFNAREARRLFGLVGAGGTLACILTGFLVKPFVAHFGTANLLVLVALLTGGFAAIVTALPKDELRRLRSPVLPRRAGTTTASASYYSGLLRTVQVRWLALLVVVATVGLTFTDYQFKTASRSHYQGADLAAFFGTFYASTSVLALLIQLFVVHRVLKNWGVLLSLCVLPSGLLLTSLGIAFTSAFGWIVAARFVVQISVFTIDSSSVQILYQGVRKQSRNQARAFVEGICKPTAMGLAGAAIVVVSAAAAGASSGLLSVGKPVVYIASACVLLSGIWLVLVRANSTAYIRALVDSLGARRFDIDQETVYVQDRAFTVRMRQLLTSAPDDEVPYLLEVLPELGTMDLCQEFRSLLGREAPAVKVAALRHLRECGGVRDTASIVPLTGHSDPEVRAAAIGALSTLDGSDSASCIEILLDDPFLEVRAAAVACLINLLHPRTGGHSDGERTEPQPTGGHTHEERARESRQGGPDAELLRRAETVLREMLSSGNAECRVKACGALAQIRTRTVANELRGLLRDSDQAVRLAALDACRCHRDPCAADAVVSLLADPDVAPRAAETLAELGSVATPSLVRCLGRRRVEMGRHAVLRIPAILAHVGDVTALPVLRDMLDEADPELRKAVTRAYCAIVRRLPPVPAESPYIEVAVRREMEAAEEQMRLLAAMTPARGRSVLFDALREQYMGHVENLFCLLDLLAMDVDMNTLFLGLTSGSEESRAGAVEILDNVLTGEIKPQLMKLLDPAKEEAPAGTTSGEEQIGDLLMRDSPEWVLVGALHAVATDGLMDLASCVMPSLSHESSVVRETALQALASVGSADVLRTACSGLARDPDPAVRRLVDSLLQEQKEVLIQP